MGLARACARPFIVFKLNAVLASVARIGAITRDVLHCATASGATPLSVADGIVRARIIRRA